MSQKSFKVLKIPLARKKIVLKCLLITGLNLLFKNKFTNFVSINNLKCNWKEDIDLQKTH